MSKKHIDQSAKIPQRDKISKELFLKIKPLTEKQKCFLDLAMNKNTKIIFVSGPSGTSKTYMSVLASLKLLNEKKVSDILYIRSAVESSSSPIGWLPGEASNKLAPYMQPLLDKLGEFLNKGDVDALQKEKRIDNIPISFMRGLSFNAKSIILDECQDMTTKELITILTRTGEFNKIFICGDEMQSDIGNRSGFGRVMNLFNNEESRENGIFVFKFDEEDIVRSQILKFIIKKVKELNNGQF